VPASWIGRAQEIEVGHMSGASNVQYFLISRNLPSTPEAIEAVLALAKKSERLLTEAEILEAVQSVADLN
jgi:2-isopropylmalate synthase